MATDYVFYNASAPNPVNETIVSVCKSSRENFAALRDAFVAGFMMEWDITPQGSDLSQPTSIICDRATERLRIKQTWGDTGGEEGNVTSQVFSYSSDGASYISMGTYTYSYNVDGEFTGAYYTSA